VALLPSKRQALRLSLRKPPLGEGGESRRQKGSPGTENMVKGDEAGRIKGEGEKNLPLRDKTSIRSTEGDTEKMFSDQHPKERKYLKGIGLLRIGEKKRRKDPGKTFYAQIRDDGSRPLPGGKKKEKRGLPLRVREKGEKKTLLEVV